MSRPEIWTRIAVCLGGAVFLGVVWQYDPATTAFYPPCLFRYFTGLLCPGCGSARALHALMHGEVAQAAALNPLTFAVLLAGLTRAVVENAPVISPRLALVAIMSFWIVRNL